MVGDPLDDATDVSALISTGERDRVAGWIAEAVAGGAKVAAGGDVDADGVLAPTRAGRRAARHEGVRQGGVRSGRRRSPPTTTSTRRCALANDTDYGLQAAIFTTDLGKALEGRPHPRLRRRAGQRGADVAGRQQPYGGVRDSGNTRKGPHYAVQGDDRAAPRRHHALSTRLGRRGTRRPTLAPEVDACYTRVHTKSKERPMNLRYALVPLALGVGSLVGTASIADASAQATKTPKATDMPKATETFTFTQGFDGRGGDLTASGFINARGHDVVVTPDQDTFVFPDGQITVFHSLDQRTRATSTRRSARSPSTTGASTRSATGPAPGRASTAPASTRPPARARGGVQRSSRRHHPHHGLGSDRPALGGQLAPQSRRRLVTRPRRRAQMMRLWPWPAQYSSLSRRL